MAMTGEKKRIVVATDFSLCASRALDHAVSLASEIDASVIAVHALEVPLYTAYEPAAYVPGDLDKPYTELAAEEMKRALAAQRDRGVPLESIVRKGQPWEVVNTVADEVSAAYIVVGTHGRRGLPRALLGSVAERIIRTATHPVISIHHAKKEE
jgi:nucleotide-binding universal stress UspA family protein